MVECPSCLGFGIFDVGDPEDGVQETCRECCGRGDVEEGDVFVPERDAFTLND